MEFDNQSLITRYTNGIYGTSLYGTELVDPDGLASWLRYKTVRCNDLNEHSHATCDGFHQFDNDKLPFMCESYLFDTINMKCRGNKCRYRHKPIPGKFIRPLPCYFTELPGDVIRMILNEAFMLSPFGMCRLYWKFITMCKKFSQCLSMDKLRYYSVYTSLDRHRNIYINNVNWVIRKYISEYHLITVDSLASRSWVPQDEVMLMPVIDYPSAITYIKSNGGELNDQFIHDAMNNMGLEVHEATPSDFIKYYLMAYSLLVIVSVYRQQLSALKFVYRAYPGRLIIHPPLKFCHGHMFRIYVTSIRTIYTIDTRYRIHNPANLSCGLHELPPPTSVILP